MSAYDIHLEDKFGSLTLIDLPAEIAAHEPWFNQTLTTVNDAVVRLGVIEGDFHWHHHDDTDEFFLVLEGQLLIDIEGADTVVLGPAPGLHRAQARRAPHARPGPDRDPDGRGGRGPADRGLTFTWRSCCVRTRAAPRRCAGGSRPARWCWRRGATTPSAPGWSRRRDSAPRT